MVLQPEKLGLGWLGSFEFDVDVQVVFGLVGSITLDGLFSAQLDRQRFFGSFLGQLYPLFLINFFFVWVKADQADVLQLLIKVIDRLSCVAFCHLGSRSI